MSFTFFKNLSFSSLANYSKPKHPEINFKTGGFLTLGTEIELQLIDTSTYGLTPRSSEVLEKTSKLNNIKQEFYLSTLEIITGKCNDAHEIEKDLFGNITRLKEQTDALGIKLATTGCHPFARYSDCIITPNSRYNELIDRNQWLTKRMTVYGLHVHIGMRTGDEAIQYMNFFLRFIPHLLALSSSSPFWQGSDTGLSSCRPTTYEALPTAGLPYWFNNWSEFEHLYGALKESKSIAVMNDLWWDIRPSPKFGTIEIRVCDGVATLGETAAIVAFIHMLSHWFSENSEWLLSLPQPERWIMRENKWRSMRHGLNADIITNPSGTTKLLLNDVLDWTEKLEPYAKKLGYEKYLKTIRGICESGNSADRQRKIFAKTGSLEEVVKHNIREFEEGEPVVG